MNGGLGDATGTADDAVAAWLRRGCVRLVETMSSKEHRDGRNAKTRSNKEHKR